MQHKCYKLCPKVREQLRKAREKAEEEESDEEESSSDSNLSEAAEPWIVQKTKNGTAGRSKENSGHPSRVESPAKIIRSPRRSHDSGRRREYEKETINGSDRKKQKYPGEIESPGRSQENRQEEYTSGRGSPSRSPNASRKYDLERRSHRRSEESRREGEYTSSRGSPVSSLNPSRKYDPEKRSQKSTGEEEYISSRGSPVRSPGSSRTNDPEGRSHRRSRESDLERGYSLEEKKPAKSHESTRSKEKRPKEYKNGSSSRTETKSPDNVRAMNRGSAEKREKDRRNRKDDSEEKAGPSRQNRGRRKEDYDREWSNSDLDQCDSHCRGINERMKKLEKHQKAFEEYLLYKEKPYFDDLCGCCCRCLVEQLWNDSFVKSTIASVGLFGLGLKLCSELNGWTLSNTS